ncbi:hypothetical protein [Moorena sp. SIO3H5]|uniref:hypothetical protein n=1 Tax=Moorena sp. SIO3H5 TaxID=2607834 RepID=UPI00342916F6
MTITPLSPPAERIQLSGISWQTYETLLNELENHRRLRLTYNRGNLEIMAPSPEHELYKKVMGRFVETLAEELKIRIYPCLDAVAHGGNPQDRAASLRVNYL